MHTQAEKEKLYQETFQMMRDISGICQGHDIGVAIAALMRVTAKVVAMSPEPDGLQKTITMLETLHKEEVKVIKNAH